jgi:tRNA threonylcarbamoyladenosine biosynthesis protein TsaB
LSRNVLVLALDTTTRAGSVAVVRDGAVLSDLVGDASLTHGARLPNDLIRALEIASVPLESIDLLAVAAGPGSFTGLRVGIAAMQGLAMARGLRIVPVSVLDALAIAGADGSVPVATWMDAQRGEVFGALYDATGTHEIVRATALPPISTLDAWDTIVLRQSIRFIGDGATRYESLLRERLGGAIEVVAPKPLAATIGRIAAAAPERALLPHAVIPIYIRKPDAEIAKTKLRG